MRAPVAPLLLLLLLACARENEPAARAAPGPALAPAPGVRFVGRVDTQDPRGPRFAWSSSGVVARFRGTRLDARLHDSGYGNFFEVVVDGRARTALATSSKQELYTVADGLSDGEHELLLSKRTEAKVGEVQFLGFVAPNGTSLLAPPPAPQRRIEFIGDSITAGYGNEGANEHCRFSPQTENAYVTYAARTARALGADFATVAWSGKTIDGMSELYGRALPERADSSWDARAWVPQVVVINLGTNDVTRGDQQGPFVASYRKLVQRVRAQYPGALIVCAVGPMLTDIYPPGAHTLTRARAYVRAAVEAEKRAGDEKVVYLEFPVQDASNGYGCDYHPSAKTHALMAERLTAVLRTELGW
jgi:lysophospholipase L1-like esterase